MSGMRTSPAIRIDRQGGPEEMKLVDVEVGEPGPGEIPIRHEACGLNFIDVYHRSGVYPRRRRASAWTAPGSWRRDARA